MEFVLSLIVFALFVSPLLTFVHELGHALPALLFSSKQVTILLGRPRALKALEQESTAYVRVGRLRVVVEPFSMFNGFAYWGTAKRPRWQHIVILAGGPAASLIAALVIWRLDVAIRPDLGPFDDLPRWSGLWAFVTFLLTAIPIKYPPWWGVYGGTTSDGYKIRRRLREA